MKPDLLVFDMDGVLVDPTETFRRALIETVHHFCGVRLTQEDIVRIKNGGGYNDDAHIALEAIESAGVKADPRAVREHGRDLYWGRGGDGYVRDERWLVAPGVLEALAANYSLAIFTGRGMQTAMHSLNRFCPGIRFDPIISNEEVQNLKPAPDGLLQIAAAAPASEILFVGDNVDDCRAGVAAGVRFMGIAAPDSPRHGETRSLFLELGAETVLASVNDLEAALS